MTILALEFSSDRRGVAVVRDGTVLGAVHHEGTRETPLFGMIRTALERACLDRKAVDCVAVGLGPGSYTGVRLAISVAQGWQLGAGIRCVGISSLENLAALAGGLGPVLLAVDSQRNEWAVAEAEGGRITGPLRLMPAADLRERIARGERVAGPEVLPLLGGGETLHPDAGVLGRMAADAEPVPAEGLVPVYLRETSFVKAPPSRKLEGASLPGA